MNLLPRHQARRHTLADNPHKETLKNLNTPPPPRLGQHTVVRNLIVQAVAQEPQVIHPFRDDAHQFPFTGHFIVKKQKHHLRDDRRILGFMPVVAVMPSHRCPDKCEVDLLVNGAQRMIRADTFIQVHLVTEQFLLRCSYPHHWPILHALLI